MNTNGLANYTYLFIPVLGAYYIPDTILGFRDIAAAHIHTNTYAYTQTHMHTHREQNILCGNDYIYTLKRKQYCITLARLHS